MFTLIIEILIVLLLFIALSTLAWYSFHQSEKQNESRKSYKIFRNALSQEKRLMLEQRKDQVTRAAVTWRRERKHS